MIPPQDRSAAARSILDVRHKYSIYGLTLRSDFGIRGFERDDPERVHDVDLRIGNTPEHLLSPLAAGARWEADASTVLMNVPNAGRFLVRSGCEVIVTPARDAGEDELGFGFHSSVITPLLHQRGALVLHGAALATRRGVVVIAGHSGAGKSTLARACVALGAQVLSDDICPLTFDSLGEVTLQTGLPAISLWSDGLDYFGHACSDLSPVRKNVRKFSIQLTRELYSEMPPLRGIMILDVRNTTDLRCEPMFGRFRFEILREHTRGLRIAEALHRVGHFRRLSQVANRVPVYRLTRPIEPLSNVGLLAERVCALADS